MADQIELNVNPAIYGGATPSPMVQGTGPSGLPQEPYVPAERVPTVDITAGSVSVLAQGEALLTANNRTKANLNGPDGAIRAAMDQWSPVRALKWLSAPSFATDTAFDSATFMHQVPFMLDEESRDFMLKSRSAEEAQYRQGLLEDYNKGRRALGDHPLAAFVVGALDPGYIALDVASVGTARALTTGRLAGRALAAGTAGAGAGVLGMVEQEVAPVSTAEIVLNSMVNAAASGLFYGAGKHTARAADFPSEAALAEAEALRRANLKPEALPDGAEYRPKVASDGTPVLHEKTGKPVYERNPQVDPNVAPEVRKVVDEVAGIPTLNRPAVSEFRGLKSGKAYNAVSGRAMLDEIIAGPDPLSAALATNLRSKLAQLSDDIQVFQVDKQDMPRRNVAGYYDTNSGVVAIPRTATAQVKMHELLHAATVDKLKFGADNPTTAHGKIAGELEQMRVEALKHYKATGNKDGLTKYLLTNNKEFTAGLYSRHAPYEQMLREIPADGSNLLSKVVDAVRRLVGFSKNESNAFIRALDLTDQLMDLPLNVKRGDRLYAANAPVTTGDELHAWVGGQVDDVAKKAGDAIAWNLHKTMSKNSQRVADILVDDPLRMSGNSADSQQRVIRATLSKSQYEYEDLLKAAAAEQGAGLRQRITSPGKARAVQAEIEGRVYDEMLRRDSLNSIGAPISHTGVDPKIKAMADKLDQIYAEALGEMQRAGVNGAEDIATRSGYIQRKWQATKITELEDQLTQSGLTQGEARGRIVDAMQKAIAKKNPTMDAQMARDVGSAIIDRAVRKGELSDAAFRHHVGQDTVAEIADMLRASQIPQARIEKVLEVLSAKTDEAGKISQLKHRIDLDLDGAVAVPGGDAVPLSSLLDKNVSTNLDRYLDTAAGQSAMARKGLTKPSDIAALRKEFLAGATGDAAKREAAQMFDDVMASLHGQPVGGDLPPAMRKMQAVTQMVGLASSGLWQLTEYSTMMQRYGLAKTFGYAIKNAPGMRALFDDVSKNAGGASNLRQVMEHYSAQDLRIRPYIQRMEDGFDMPVSDQVMLSLQQQKQLVPYLNGMRFVHHHQANVASNLIADAFEKAAGGNEKYRKMLESYGLERQVYDKIAPDLKAHGLDTSKWADATMDTVRGPMLKMMDEAVLRNRRGEIPAFAQFSQVGKFMFTFRSFVLGAHNKILAGTLNRNGFAGLGLMMMYQYPLSMLAVEADNTIKGKGPLTDDARSLRVVSQMGSIGLGSELFGYATGQKQQWGSPGLIALDRAIKMFGNVSAGVGASLSGEDGTSYFSDAGSDLLNAIPLLAIAPGVKAIAETLK